MATENEALVIIEEGTDVEVQMEGMSCCWTAYIIFH